MGGPGTREQRKSEKRGDPKSTKENTSEEGKMIRGGKKSEG